MGRPAAGTADLDDFQQADLTQGLAFGLTVLAAGLAVATVLICTKRQRELLARLGVHA